MPGVHPSARDLRFVQDVLRVVEEHLAEREFNVRKLSLLLGMSRVTLHRRLKAVIHKPAGEFIREQRLEHAAELLRQGEYTVHEAAEQSGFFNQSYFSKCFKERYGVKPSEYLLANHKSQTPKPKQIQNSKIK